MPDEFSIASKQALQQASQTLTALSRVLATIAPEVTQLELTLAVEACRAAGYGSELPEAILKKAFNGAGPAVFLSPEEFAKKQEEISQKS